MTMIILWCGKDDPYKDENPQCIDDKSSDNDMIVIP